MDIVKSKEHSLRELDDILFNQIAILEQTDVKDEDFDKIRSRAEAITCIADRVMRNRELELRNQVWSATKKFRLSQKQIGICDIGEY